MKEITMVTLSKMQDAMISAAENVLKAEGFTENEVYCINISTKVEEVDGIFGFYQSFDFNNLNEPDAMSDDETVEELFEKLEGDDAVENPVNKDINYMIGMDRELTLEKIRSFVRQRAAAVIFKRRSLLPEVDKVKEEADKNEFFMVEKIERSTDLTNHVTLRIVYRYFIDEFTDSEHLFQFIASWADGSLKCQKSKDVAYIEKNEIILQADFDFDLELLRREFEGQAEFKESHGFILCKKIK